jgi:hypothetical protein
MTFTGIARGSKIELDGSVPFPDGTRVTVDISAESVPPKSSPAAILQLAGTLTDEEAEAIDAAARLCRRIDDRLWTNPS